MKVNGAIDHLISALAKLLKYWGKLFARNRSQWFLTKTFIPKNCALIEQRWVV